MSPSSMRSIIEILISRGEVEGEVQGEAQGATHPGIP